MKINKKISKYNYSSRYGNKVKYIVIHWVGAVSSARNNAMYFATGNRLASAHFFVDAKEIWQSVELSNAAWHCGGGLQDWGYKKGGASFFRKCTNSNSIGIELCCIKKKGKVIVDPKAVKKAAPLVQMLMKKYNVPITRVIRHFDVTGKVCPNGYIKAGNWKRLRNKLCKVPKAEKKQEKKQVDILMYPSYPVIYLDRKSDNISEIKLLQKCLSQVLKIHLHQTGKFGSHTERAVRKFQKKHNLVVDGIYGAKTRDALRKELL